MDKDRKSVVISWGLVVAWAVFIFVMSATTEHDFKTGTGIAAMLKTLVSDVLSAVVGHEVDPSPIGHFGEYLVFGGLLVNALRHYVSPAATAGGAVAIAAFYAVTDEFHQLFVPGRACDPADWVVDVSAAMLAALIGWLVLRRNKPSG